MRLTFSSDFKTTLLTLDRAIGASIARLVLYVQAVDAYTSETVVDINRKQLDSRTTFLP